MNQAGNRGSIRRAFVRRPASGQKGHPLKKRGWILFWGLAVLAIGAMIFFFSAQDAAESSETSGFFTQWVIRLLRPDYDGLSRREKAALWQQYQYFVRKGAHFAEFFLLGAALRLLLHFFKLRWKSGWAWLVGTLYAAADEGHQMLVNARAGMWQDVCLDSAGVLAGVLAALGIVALRRRRRKKEK